MKLIYNFISRNTISYILAQLLHSNSDCIPGGKKEKAKKAEHVNLQIIYELFVFLLKVTGRRIST